MCATKPDQNQTRHRSAGISARNRQTTDAQATSDINLQNLTLNAQVHAYQSTISGCKSGLKARIHTRFWLTLLMRIIHIMLNYRYSYRSTPEPSR